MKQLSQVHRQNNH